MEIYSPNQVSERMFLYCGKCKGKRLHTAAGNQELPNSEKYQNKRGLLYDCECGDTRIIFVSLEGKL
jgi:hypothetical protein